MTTDETITLSRRVPFTLDIPPGLTLDPSQPKLSYSPLHPPDTMRISLVNVFGEDHPPQVLDGQSALDLARQSGFSPIDSEHDLERILNTFDVPGASKINEYSCLITGVSLHDLQGRQYLVSIRFFFDGDIYPLISATFHCISRGHELDFSPTGSDHPLESGSFELGDDANYRVLCWPKE